MPLRAVFKDFILAAENFDDGWDWNKILCEVFEYWVLTEASNPVTILLG